MMKDAAQNVEVCSYFPGIAQAWKMYSLLPILAANFQYGYHLYLSNIKYS